MKLVSAGVAQATVVMLLAAGPLAAADEATSGRLLASQCAQCHGTDGRAIGDMEELAGEDGLLEELLEMKRSTDLGDIMHRQAKGYDDTQLRLIADYFAAQGGGDGGSEGEGDSGDEREDEHEEDHDGE